VPVPSRYGANFVVEVFDWNQIEAAKSLGIGKIDLSIEPLLAVEQVVNLVSPKLGEKGEVRLRLMFQPKIVAKTRKQTSTFMDAGRAMTQIGAIPLSAGKGVFQGVTGVFRHKEETIPEDSFGENPHAAGNNVPVAAATLPLENGQSAPGELGTLKVAVMDAKGLTHDIKPYATVRVGDKEFKTKHVGKSDAPEWNESFSFAVSPLTPKVSVRVHDHKTLGKNKEVAEGEVEIWRHIKSDDISSAEFQVQLRPNGTLRLRLEFEAGANMSSSLSIHSGEHHSRGMSLSSPPRFSSIMRRPGPVEDES